MLVSRPPTAYSTAVSLGLDGEQPDPVREQIALARTLLDELERVRPADMRRRLALEAQTIEELTRLGCRLLEDAAAIAAAMEDEAAATAPPRITARTVQ